MKRTLSVLMMILGASIALAEVPPVPETPASIESLLYARPFTLDEGFRFDWRQERPLVTQGVLLVIEVDQDLVYPRQVAEPVLYVGDQTAMRLNIASCPACVIASANGP